MLRILLSKEITSTFYFSSSIYSFIQLTPFLACQLIKTGIIEISLYTQRLEKQDSLTIRQEVGDILNKKMSYLFKTDSF